MTSSESVLSPEKLRRLPKVVLHDHLDGALRPQTILELSREAGHRLPANTADELGTWFTAAADSGSLVRYLETFEHTVAVMQTETGIARVAKEYVLDVAADGVVYAETRYAPEQSLTSGLTLPQVVDAVQIGLSEGMAEAAANGTPIQVGTILCAMRMFDRSREIAELAVANREHGVVGFDIAGAEEGFPAQEHRSSFEFLREQCFPYTIHAGEAAGPESIWGATQICGALRIGHGVRIVEDITWLDGSRHRNGPPPAEEAVLGHLAAWIRDRAIPLEVCPTSNVQTGAAKSVAEHPASLLRDLGFAVTINTDNRLMGGTTLTKEMSLLMADAGWSLEDLRDATVTAMDSAFIPLEERRTLLWDVISPAWEDALAPG